MVVGLLPVFATSNADNYQGEEIDSLLIEFTMFHGGQTVDLLATGGTPQAWNFRNGQPFAFEVKIEDTDGTESFYVISAHNDEVKSMELTYDVSRGVWLADGFFDPSNMWYVPGQLSVGNFGDISAIFQNISVDFSKETNFDEVVDYLTPEWRNAITTILEDAPDRVVTHIVLDDEDQTEMEMTIEMPNEEIITTDEELRADGFVPSIDDNGNLIYTRITGDMFSDEGAILEIIQIESVEIQGRSLVLLGVAALKIGIKAFGASKVISSATASSAKIAVNAIGAFDITSRVVRDIRVGEDPRTIAANAIAGTAALFLPGASQLGVPKLAGFLKPILVGAGEFMVHKIIENEFKHHLTRAFSHGTATSGDVIAIANPSTLSQDLRLSPNQTLLVSSTLNLNGQTMSTGNLFVTNNVNLNGGTLNVDGDLIQADGRMHINSGRLNVSGDYIIATVTTDVGGNRVYSDSNGYLNMVNAMDYIYIGGDFLVRSNSVSFFGNGTLEIKGDFTQLNHQDSQDDWSGNHHSGFFTSGPHRIMFSGVGRQNIFVEHSNASFGLLEMSATSILRVSNFFNASLMSNINLESDGAIILRMGMNGYTMNIDGDIEINPRGSGVPNFNGGTLNVSGNLIQPSGTIQIGDGTLNVNGDFTQAGWIQMSGSSILNVAGDLIQTSGQMVINGGRLNVGGDYEISGVGGLQMTDINGYVYIGRNFLIFSNSTNLTAGTIEIKGNFAVLEFFGFTASGTHRVILSGVARQNVSFANTFSRFNYLDLRNPSQEGVVFLTDVVISNFFSHNFGNYTFMGNYTFSDCDCNHLSPIPLTIENLQIGTNNTVNLQVRSNRHTVVSGRIVLTVHNNNGIFVGSRIYDIVDFKPNDYTDVNDILLNTQIQDGFTVRAFIWTCTNLMSPLSNVKES